jgi:nitroreductase
MPDDTHDFILGLRAIRDYKPDPLSNEDLGAILEAGRWTGSSKNRQSWSFIVVTDPERIQGLASHGDFTDPVRNSVATIVLVQEQGGNMFDIGRAAQNMMLAAAAIGVASCPINLHPDADAASYHGVPEHANARYAIAGGYPAVGATPANLGGRE